MCCFSSTIDQVQGTQIFGVSSRAAGVLEPETPIYRWRIQGSLPNQDIIVPILG